MLGSVWDRFGIILELFRDHFGIVLESFWDRFVIVLESFWDRFGIILGLFWDRFGIVLGSFFAIGSAAWGASQGNSKLSFAALKSSVQFQSLLCSSVVFCAVLKLLHFSKVFCAVLQASVQF